jgi:hypothetical protein
MATECGRLRRARDPDAMPGAGVVIRLMRSRTMDKPTEPHTAENDSRRVMIDFTVRDDQGNELAWGGTGYASSIKALADELQAMVERGEFPHSDRVFPPASTQVDR